MYHFYEVVKDLQINKQSTSNLRVLIYPSRHGDYFLQGASMGSSFLRPTKDLFTVQDQASSLLKRRYIAGIPYQNAGVILTDLADTASQSCSLFNDDITKNEILTETMCAINKKLGKSLIG